MSSNTKLILLGALAVVVSAIGWFALRRALLATLELPADWFALALPALLLLLFLAFESVVGLVVRSGFLRLGLFAAAALPLFFVFSFTWYAAGAVAALLAGAAWGSFKAQREERERIAFSVAKSLRPALTVPIAAMLVAVSLIYYGIHLADYSADDQSQLLSGASRLVAPLASSGTVEYDPTMTLDQYLEANLLGGEGERIPADVLAAARREFLSRYQIAATGTTPMEEVWTRIVEVQLEEWLGPFERYLPPLIAFSLFFLLSAFTFLYRPLITLFASALVWLFRKSGVIAVSREPKEVERVTL